MKVKIYQIYTRENLSYICFLNKLVVDHQPKNKVASALYVI